MPSNSRPLVALFEPKIPQNTGNIVRTCAAVGADLALIEPLGFRFSSRLLRRAGLDYFDKVSIERLGSIDEIFQQERATYLFSAHAEKTIDKLPFGPDDIYLFGSETDGLPKGVLEGYAESTYKIPQRADVRCLNLSNSVAIVLYARWLKGGIQVGC